MATSHKQKNGNTNDCIQPNFRRDGTDGRDHCRKYRLCSAKGDTHTVNMFQGPKVSTGTAIRFCENGKSMLKVFDGFKVPDTRAAAWRIVDSKGEVSSLDAFKIKGGEKRQILELSYVPNIAKVQFDCAFAEVCSLAKRASLRL